MQLQKAMQRPARGGSGRVVQLCKGHEEGGGGK